MLNITNIPPPRVPVIDNRTGLISREGYRFFFNLFLLTGGGASDATVEDLQGAPVASDQSGNFDYIYDQAQLAALSNFDNQQIQNALDQAQLAALVNSYSQQVQNALDQAQLAALVNSYSQQVQNVLDQISTQPPSVPIIASTNYQTPPTSIVVGASPFLYTNITGNNVDVMISGGGISALAFSRDGTTFYDTGSYYGMFSLSPSDMLRVTYISAPVMTLIQR